MTSSRTRNLSDELVGWETFPVTRPRNKDQFDRRLALLQHEHPNTFPLQSENRYKTLADQAEKYNLHPLDQPVGNPCNLFEAVYLCTKHENLLPRSITSLDQLKVFAIKEMIGMSKMQQLQTRVSEIQGWSLPEVGLADIMIAYIIQTNIHYFHDLIIDALSRSLAIRILVLYDDGRYPVSTPDRREPPSRTIVVGNVVDSDTGEQRYIAMIPRSREQREEAWLTKQRRYRDARQERREEVRITIERILREQRELVAQEQMRRKSLRGRRAQREERGQSSRQETLPASYSPYNRYPQREILGRQQMGQIEQNEHTHQRGQKEQKDHTQEGEEGEQRIRQETLPSSYSPYTRHPQRSSSSSHRVSDLIEDKTATFLGRAVVYDPPPTPRGSTPPPPTLPPSTSTFPTPIVASRQIIADYIGDTMATFFERKDFYNPLSTPPPSTPSPSTHQPSTSPLSNSTPARSAPVHSTPPSSRHSRKRAKKRYTNFLDFWNEKYQKESEYTKRQPPHDETLEPSLQRQPGQIPQRPEGVILPDPRDQWIHSIPGVKLWSVAQSSSLFHSVFAVLYCMGENSFIDKTVPRWETVPIRDGAHLKDSYINYMKHFRLFFIDFVHGKLMARSMSINYEEWLEKLSDDDYIPGNEVKATLAEMLGIKLVVYQDIAIYDPLAPFRFFPSTREHRCKVTVAETLNGCFMALMNVSEQPTLAAVRKRSTSEQSTAGVKKRKVSESASSSGASSKSPRLTPRIESSDSQRSSPRNNASSRNARASTPKRAHSRGVDSIYTTSPSSGIGMRQPSSPNSSVASPYYTVVDEWEEGEVDNDPDVHTTHSPPGTPNDIEVRQTSSSPKRRHAEELEEGEILSDDEGNHGPLYEPISDEDDFFTEAPIKKEPGTSVERILAQEGGGPVVVKTEIIKVERQQEPEPYIKQELPDD